MRSSAELKVAINKRITRDLKNPNLSKERLFNLLTERRLARVVPLRLLRKAFSHPSFNSIQYLEYLGSKSRVPGSRLRSCQSLTLEEYILLKEDLKLLVLFKSPTLDELFINEDVLSVVENYYESKLTFLTELFKVIFHERSTSKTRLFQESQAFLARNLSCLSRKNGEVKQFLASLDTTLKNAKVLVVTKGFWKKEEKDLLVGLFVSLKRHSHTSFRRFFDAAKETGLLVDLFEAVEKDEKYKWSI